MNHLQDTKNMIAILIVIGILTAAALAMLFAVPSVLKSNTPNLSTHTNNDTLNSRNVSIPIS